jgi:hypothetical protein
LLLLTKLPYQNFTSSRQIITSVKKLTSQIAYPQNPKLTSYIIYNPKKITSNVAFKFLILKNYDLLIMIEGPQKEKQLLQKMFLKKAI